MNNNALLRCFTASTNPITVINMKILFHWQRQSLLVTLVLFFACQNSDRHPSTDNSTTTGGDIFSSNCKLCHGADGRLGLNGAKDLTISQLPLNERVNIITNGKNLMAPFGKLLTAAEIDSVAAYTLHLNQKMAK